MGRIAAGKASEITGGSMRKIAVDGRDILLANIDGNYFAVDDTCTHSGASLSEGKLEGESIVCGWHGAQFSCKTGCLEKFPAKINDLKSYNVIVETGEVFIEV